jgi:hypothetical protein
MINDHRKGRLYLVFEYIEKNLLEVLEENINGIDVSIFLLNIQSSYSRSGSANSYTKWSRVLLSVTETTWCIGM